MPPIRRAVTAALALVLAAAAPAVGSTSTTDTGPDAPPQQNSALGYEGYCLDGHGVTVVVDFQDLGAWKGHDGKTIVRCAPGPAEGKDFAGTGRDVLREAGVDMTGTERWGLTMACRLDGRPAADETIPRQGDPTYREACVDTPPANAYWSYWYADDGAAWTYSTVGLTSRSAIPGGFEGWSFSLNRSATTNPPPRSAAVRPLADRLSGSTRYATAAEVAGKYVTGVDVVYVATGRGFPDALAGSALAGRQDVPVLLTAPDELPAETVEALQRLKPKRIVVLGGSTVVSDPVVTALKKYTSGTVTRLRGANRYATAEQVSRQFPVSTTRVYVATGDNFPDALAASARAGSQGVPVLLTRKGELPQETVTALNRLQPTQIFVVGGSTVISDAVVTQLRQHAGTVTRLSGANRYGTAEQVSRTGFTPGVPVAYVATGANFPDALAGSALAGRTRGPVLLTRQDTIPPETARELGRLDPQTIIVLGGTTTVSDSVLNQLKQYVVRP